MYRQHMIDIYLEWINNYCSVETFADHAGLYYDEALQLINLAKQIYNADNPDK